MMKILVSKSLPIIFLCFLFSCSSGKKESNLSFNQKIKLKQYIVQGEILYKLHCSNCHQKDGSGLGKLIPPLTPNIYLQKNNKQLACILKYGITGKIEINNIIYDEIMPSNPSLTNLEIAEILTYIGNNWGNKLSIINTDDVTKSLVNCTIVQQ